MVINGAIVSDLDMMYIESVLQVRGVRPGQSARKRSVGSAQLLEMRALFYSELAIRKREVHYL